jgi:peptidyl-prolyl cis-trans isomerase B (cyclophilin B)
MKWLIPVVALLLVVGCGGQKPAPAPAAVPPVDTTAQAPAVDTTKPAPVATPAAGTEVKGMLKDTLVVTKLPENLFMTIKVKDYGTMKIQFYTKDAPKNVTNVANLGIKGFYNGLTFHRLIPGFMIQGGDPSGNGTGGPGYTVPAEIKRRHEKGSMAMARTGDQVNPERRSSGSQFYICFQPTPQLDGQYTVIGQLVQGMEVLEKLEKVSTGAMDKPTTPVVMEKVTVSTE